MKQKTLLFWSSGKDSAWALYTLRQDPSVEIVGLVTNFHETSQRVAMHAVRRGLVEAQARAAGLPLWPVLLPWPCPNQEYERKILEVVNQAKAQGVTHFAFGDLFLEDIRAYRRKLLTGTGIEPVFPVWTSTKNTPLLAREMLRNGLRALLTCVDCRQLDKKFAGREFAPELLDELPASVDPCGERGEFHTFCYAGPMFHEPIAVRVGEIEEKDGFVVADVLAETKSESFGG